MIFVFIYRKLVRNGELDPTSRDHSFPAKCLRNMMKVD
jgi:hypothetical protein